MNDSYTIVKGDKTRQETRQEQTRQDKWGDVFKLDETRDDTTRTRRDGTI